MKLPLFPALCLFTGQRSPQQSSAYASWTVHSQLHFPEDYQQMVIEQCHWLARSLAHPQRLREGFSYSELVVAKPNWFVLTVEGGIIAEEYVTSSVSHTSTTTNSLKFGHRRDEYFPFFFFVQIWILTDAFPDKPRGWTHLVLSWVTSEADLRQRFKCKELL